jgi:hypothetical protein
MIPTFLPPIIRVATFASVYAAVEITAERRFLGAQRSLEPGVNSRVTAVDKPPLWGHIAGVLTASAAVSLRSPRLASAGVQSGLSSLASLSQGLLLGSVLAAISAPAFYVLHIRGAYPSLGMLLEEWSRTGTETTDPDGKGATDS